jgi:hypothetical protein
MSNLDTTTQADAATTPATPATPAEATKRESVAKHELITEPGGEHTSDITKALGIRYVDKASGEKFEFMLPDAIAGHPMTMLALFGAKTKATNEASRVRNGQGGDTTAQFEAIDEVFANISNGVWREKAEGGGGSRTDKRLLAEVLVTMLGEKAQGTIDTYQNRLETEEPYYKKVWSNDQIKTEYKKRAGKTGPAIDSLV